MPAKAKPKAPLGVDDLSFEQAFDEMEAIVRQLESGQLPLDASLALFERGQALANRCQQLLEAAELRIQQITPRGDGGYVIEDVEGGER